MDTRFFQRKEKEQRSHAAGQANRRSIHRLVGDNLPGGSQQEEHGIVFVVQHM